MSILFPETRVAAISPGFKYVDPVTDSYTLLEYTAGAPGAYAPLGRPIGPDLPLAALGLTITSKVNRCLQDGSKIQVAGVVIKSWLNLGWNDPLGLVVPDVDIDPDGDVISRQGDLIQICRRSVNLLRGGGAIIDP